MHSLRVTALVPYYVALHNRGQKMKSFENHIYGVFRLVLYDPEKSSPQNASETEILGLSLILEGPHNKGHSFLFDF